MKINEFGNKDNPKIVLIPGTMMCWKRFGNVIPLLEEDGQSSTEGKRLFKKSSLIVMK